jgi:DNA-binding transcriptional MerR regulator
MHSRDYKIVLLRTEHQRLTLDELAARTGMHPAMIEELIAYGLITPSEREGARLSFDPSVILKLQRFARLRGALGINLPGIAVILDLIDKLQAVKRENEALRGRL